MVVGHGRLGRGRVHMLRLCGGPSRSSCVDRSRRLRSFIPAIAPCLLHKTPNYTLSQVYSSTFDQNALKLHASVVRRPAQPRETLHASCVPPTGLCPRSAICAYAPAAADVETSKRDAGDCRKR